MVLRVASPKQAGERPPIDWIDRVFPLSEGVGTVGTGFEVLGRASAMRADGVRPWIERLLAASLHERARLAFEAAKAVGLSTAHAVLGNVLAEQLEVQGDARLARELEDAGIPDSTVSLRRVAEWVSRTLLRELKGSEDERVLAERARHQNNLGVRLSELGRREEALKATQEAVGGYRALSRRQPDAFRLDLATSLNNLGIRLSELGRGEEALRAIQEAVEECRALCQRQPDAFQPDLARSLNNLGDRLSELGRREEALASYEEALDMIWPLFKRLPPPFMQNTGLMIKDLLQVYEALQRPLPPILVERIEEFMRLAGLNRPSG
jgi:tetratricopeptide (TPR) repeat protein